jgi:hypothetical protein
MAGLCFAVAEFGQLAKLPILSFLEIFRIVIGLFFASCNEGVRSRLKGDQRCATKLL